MRFLIQSIGDYEIMSHESILPIREKIKLHLFNCRDLYEDFLDNYDKRKIVDGPNYECLRLTGIAEEFGLKPHDISKDLGKLYKSGTVTKFGIGNKHYGLTKIAIEFLEKGYEKTYPKNNVKTKLEQSNNLDENNIDKIEEKESMLSGSEMREPRIEHHIEIKGDMHGIIAGRDVKADTIIIGNKTERIPLGIIECILSELERLTDDEINRFCLIHFPEVKRKFSGGMPRTEKINILIDYCQLKNRVNKLYTLLRKNNENI